MTAPRLRLVHPAPTASEAVKAAELAFGEACRRRYLTTTTAIEDDLAELDCMAGEVAACILKLERHFERLNMARDVQSGHQIKRGQFNAEWLIDGFTESLALSPEAASVLAARVRSAL